MEQIIERIKAALGEIVNGVTLLKVERSGIEKIGQKQDTVARVQGEKEAELDKREAAIEPIEDVVKFEKAAKTLAEESRQGMVALERAKDAFEVYKNDEQAKIVARNKEVAELAATHKRELVALKQAREAVEKERSKIGADIVKNLTGAIPK